MTTVQRSRAVRRRSLDGPRISQQVGASALLVVVGGLVLTPVVFIVWGTFVSGDGAGLDAAGRAWTGAGTTGLLGNTFVFAAGSTVVALVVGTVLAYLHARTDAPCRRLLLAAALVPMAMPGMLYAFSWILLASPRIGILPTALTTGPLSGLLDPFGLSGMVWVSGIHLSSIAFLLMLAAFKAMDPALEDAALISGATRRRVWRRITLPLARPALITTVLLVALRSVESFEVPALLGMPGGISVLTTRLFHLLRRYPPDAAAAGAVGLALLALALIGLLAHHWLLRSRAGFEVLTGRRRASTTVTLGRARPWVGACVVGWFLLVVVAPVGVLVWASLLPYYRTPGRDPLSTLTLDNYRDLFTSADLVGALSRSLALGAGAATITVVIGCLIAWTVVRSRARGRFVLDGMSLAPLVMPGLVLGLAISFVWLRVPLPVYGTPLILFIGYVTAYLPYGSRYADAALRGIGSELEESARVSGAGWVRTMRRVILPLAGPGLAAAWLSIVVLSLRELSLSLLLYSPGHEVLPVLLWARWEDGRLPELATIGLFLVAVLVITLLLAYRLAKRVVLPALE